MNTNTLELYYMATRDEVEEIFGYPTRRALELFAVNGGGPKMTKISRRCYYRIADVDAWLKSFEIVHPSEPENAS